MLILSRKLNESIVIGNVTVTVVHLDRQRCRLGIAAPAGVKIRRGELTEEPMEDRASVAQTFNEGSEGNGT